MLRFCTLTAISLLAVIVLDPSAYGQPKPRLDAYGDPLPDGALLRIGTVRFRAGSRIDTLVFSADSKSVIAAERTSGVHVFDIATGKEQKSLPCILKDDFKRYDPSPFATIRVSPRGNYVAEVNNQSICVVREVATGKELCRIDRKHWQNLCHVRFAPDEKTFALLANASGEASVFETATGKLVNKLPRHDAIYPFLAFSPAGKRLAIAGQNIPIMVYDVATGAKLAPFGDAKEGSFGSGVFSPDGKRFAFYSKHYSRLEVWDATTYKRLTTIHGAFNSSPLTFSADSRWIISPVAGSELGIWDAATGKLIRKHTDRFGGFWHTAVSPDGKYLATAHGQCVQLWHLDTGKPVHDFAGHVGYYVRVRFGLDGKTLISESPGRVHGSDATAYIWDAATGKQLADIGWAGGVWPVGATSADGRVQVEGRGGEKIVIRALETKRILLQIDEPTCVPNSVALTPTGQYLALGLHEQIPNGRNKIQLWHVDSGKKLLDLHEQGRAEFDATGSRLLVFTGYKPRQLRCYDVATGRPITRARMIVGNSHRLVYSALGGVAAERWNGSLKLRELVTGEIVATMEGTGLAVQDLAFSPDGRLLAAGASEGAIVVWDVMTGREVARRIGHRSYVRSISWSPDGTRLASSGDDLTILVWDAKPWRKEIQPLAAKPTPKQLAALWDDLAEVKGERGYRAILQLGQTPKDALGLLGKHLRPTTLQKIARLRQWIENLGNSRFSVRTKAQRELESMGDLAIPFLQKALVSPPTLETRRRVEAVLGKLQNEPPPAAQLRTLRALTLLEMIGGAGATAVLDTLADGAPEAWLTQEAQAAKNRLADRSRP